jgi:signal transduction histidine kinase
VELRLKGGPVYRWFRARGQAIWNERGEPMRMAGALGDIDDARCAAQAVEQARQAEFEAKQEFARQLILAQEQERQRLANELHDSVGQNLSLIRNRCQMLQRMELPPAAQHQAEALQALAGDAIEEVRSVAHNLRPLHIEEMGVTDAIEGLIERVRNSSALTVESHVENVDDVIQGSAATHLFRIVQEAISNALKHAEATHLRVRLERDLQHVRLTLQDDGKGFELRDAQGRTLRAAGLGLLSMQERAGILHANVVITGAPGRGTRVDVTIPVVEEESDS